MSKITNWNFDARKSTKHELAGNYMFRVNNRNIPNRHFLVQSQQSKHQINVRNQLKIYIKDVKDVIFGATTAYSEQITHIVLVFPLLNLSK